jgi:mannose/fructose/N-acetylgalactosamine-specific phosphotransferase system component IIC
MSVTTVSTFFAVGTLLLGAALITLVLVWLGSLVSNRLRTVRRAFAASFDGYGLRLAWLVSIVATLGSLFYSQVAHYIPCELCWYQRIAMYPLVVVLGIAVVRRDEAVRRYVIPVAAIGAIISTYHYVIQQFPDLAVTSCSATGVPCTGHWVWKFGFVSIPLMALACFGTILAVLILDRAHRTPPVEIPDPQPIEEAS